jgi:hypothetical protein
MLEHGGGLIAAARKYNRPVHEWLDLSTDINPIPYAVPEIPTAVWRRLPQDNDELLEEARGYFDTEALLASSIRFGLPTTAAEFLRLRTGLSEIEVELNRISRSCSPCP